MTGGNAFSKFPPVSIALVALVLASSAVASSGIQDPTRPDAYQSRQVGEKKVYRLTSVLISEQRKIATINGKSYVEGERMALGRLVSIQKDRVVIDGAGRRVLRLHDAAVRDASGKQ